MLKKLVAFGCSFTYGDELVDPNLPADTNSCDYKNAEYREKHCYAGIIAEHYNLELLNTAFPGSSLEAMRYALWWVKNNINVEECMFVIGYPNPFRHSFFVAERANVPDDYMDYHPERPDPPWNLYYHAPWLPLEQDKDLPWHDMYKLWLTHSYHEAWENFNLDQTVGYFNSFNRPTVHMMADARSSGTSQLLNNHCGFNLHDCLIAEDYCKKRHPNENGHLKIAQRLIEYIDRVKLIG